METNLPKLNESELFEKLGIKRGGTAYCLHCDRTIEIAAVLDNPLGDLCPFLDCDGGGWGIDLYGEKWWA